MLAFSLFS